MGRNKKNISTGRQVWFQLQSAIISTLGNIRMIEAQDFLLYELSKRSSNDPLLLIILSAFHKVTYLPQQGADLVNELLCHHPDNKIRLAAVDVIGANNNREIREILLDIFEKESDSDLRVKSLEKIQNDVTPRIFPG